MKEYAITAFVQSEIGSRVMEWQWHGDKLWVRVVSDVEWVPFHRERLPKGLQR